LAADDTHAGARHEIKWPGNQLVTKSSGHEIKCAPSLGLVKIGAGPGIVLFYALHTLLQNYDALGWVTDGAL